MMKELISNCTEVECVPRFKDNLAGPATGMLRPMQLAPRKQGSPSVMTMCMPSAGMQPDKLLPESIGQAVDGLHALHRMHDGQLGQGLSEAIASPCVEALVTAAPRSDPKAELVQLHGDAAMTGRKRRHLAEEGVDHVDA